MNTLATAARFEATDRLNRYPPAIRDGKIGADAAVMDTEVWDTIATALEAGIPIKEMLLRPHRRHGVGWRDVADALDRAVANRNKACAKTPEDANLATRRDAVAAIAAQIGPHAAWFIALTDQLRARNVPVPLDKAA